MIDTHAHLDFPNFDEDREEVIARFFENGGKAIVNVGVDIERSGKSIELAEKYEGVYASVGVHPDYFSNHESRIMNYEKDLQNLKLLARHKRVVAIGETGLDYFHIAKNLKIKEQEIGSIKENQKKGFVAQIELARELGLPVIVHCRDFSDEVDLGGRRGEDGAWEDLYKIISDFKIQISNQFQNPNFKKNTKYRFHELNQIDPNAKKINEKRIPNTRDQTLDTNFVLHCYSGSANDTDKFLKLPNVFFSFSGNITYPKPSGSHPSAPTQRSRHLPSGRGGGLAVESIRMIPLGRIMLDSDSPFLAPQSRRGKRNEPFYVSDIACKIAEIKGISAHEAELVTDENAMSFFGI